MFRLNTNDHVINKFSLQLIPIAFYIYKMTILEKDITFISYQWQDNNKRMLAVIFVMVYGLYVVMLCYGYGSTEVEEKGGRNA